MFMIIKSIGSVLQFLYHINITIERCLKLFDTPYDYDIVFVFSLKVYASKFLNCYRVHFLLLIIQDTTRLEWKLIIRR